MATQSPHKTDKAFHESANQSWTLPSSWYIDADIFDLEKREIFCRGWWYVGAQHDVSAPGQFMTTTVVDQDVFVIRTQTGELRAFYNVCRHRAHRLLEGKGCRDKIICPYHGWTYDSGGRFCGARGVEGIIGFESDAFGLVEVRVATMLGLVFINLDEDAHALDDIAGPMMRDMHAHCPELDNLNLVRSYQLDTAANWKVLVDNDLESYHSAIAHRSLLTLLDYSGFEIWEDKFTTCHAMSNSDTDNDAYAVAANAQVTRAIYTWMWPNTAFFIAPGRANLGVFQMLPTGPETSVQNWDFYFAGDELDESEQGYLDWTIDTLIPEDTVLYENVQRGLRSQAYSAGRFVVNHDRPEWDERHVHMFQKLVRESIGNPGN